MQSKNCMQSKDTIYLTLKILHLHYLHQVYIYSHIILDSDDR